MHQTGNLLGIKMIKFYLHVPELPGWQSVLAEMLGKMDTSGLLESADEINFCVNGILANMEIPLLKLNEIDPKFKIVHVNGDATKWEYPTINKLKEDADNSNEAHYVGYAHLKALSRPNILDQKGVDWRNYLSYWTIERWEDNIAKLDEGFDLVGVNWTWQPWPHMSGNFWWANTNYLRQLPKLQDPSTVVPGTISALLKPNVPLDQGNIRFEAEAWSGQHEPNVYELHRSHLLADPSFHYNNVYPPELYRED